MAKMTVIYKTPKDKEAFNQHYFKVHIPLAKKLPGLRKYEVSEGPIFSPRDSDVYFIANLRFDSMDAIKTAFASETGKLCAADRRVLVPDDNDVAIYLFDTKEI